MGSRSEINEAGLQWMMQSIGKRVKGVVLQVHEETKDQDLDTAIERADRSTPETGNRRSRSSPCALQISVVI